jgi:hypothetical protein
MFSIPLSIQNMLPALKHKIELGARLSLVLSLTIASSLTARVAQAEPTSPYRCTQVLSPAKTTPKKNRTKKKKLGQTITKLVKLSPTQQELVDQAIDRAIATQISNSATGVERPVRRVIGAMG